MRTQKHAKEPWEAVTLCPGECCWHLQQVGNDNPMDLISNPEMSRENARRIVACVNACEGIDSATLEATVGLNELYDEIQSERDSIKQQRDELLAACHDALNNLPPDGDCAALIRERIATVTAAS